MKYSSIALDVLTAKECGIIKSNSQFWKSFSELENFKNEILNYDSFAKTRQKILDEMKNTMIHGFCCLFDDNFPLINKNVKRNSDKPYLLFYKGDLSLLNDLNKNIAIIGQVDPDDSIIKREESIVKSIVKEELVVVSGLALGCDAVAHSTCIDNNGKTIAVLPSTIDKIYPSENKEIAEKIVKNGGLLVSEYHKNPISKHEAISRFIERDRLQAMFSKTIILISSYRKGEGDSGSRHAMEAAKKYGIDRFVMFNKATDHYNIKFGLNKDLIENEVGVKILQSSSIEYLKKLKNENLIKTKNNLSEKQLRFL